MHNFFNSVLSFLTEFVNLKNKKTQNLSARVRIRMHTKWDPRTIAKLVNITPISLWFMVVITIVNGVYEATYNWGPHIVDIFRFGIYTHATFREDFYSFPERLGKERAASFTDPFLSHDMTLYFSWEDVVVYMTWHYIWGCCSLDDIHDLTVLWKMWWFARHDITPSANPIHTYFQCILNS